MKITTREADDEKQIVVAMIVDRVVLAKIYSQWKPNSFRSRYANIIAKWCIKHYERYGNAPGEIIDDYFFSWSDRHKNEGEIEMVDTVLSQLANRYHKLKKKSNSEYILDMAEIYFNKVNIERLVAGLESDMEDGNIFQAQERIASYGKMEMASTSIINVLADDAAIAQVFEENREPIIKYNGALKQFFGSSLGRDCFISFIAPEKRGKTFWLLDIAWRAIMQNRKVILFECGDMTERQTMERIISRAIHRPIYKNKKSKKPIHFARFIDEGKERHELECEEIKYETDATPKEIHAKFEKIIEKKYNGEDDRFKLSTHPASSISANDIHIKLKELEREGWAPDVVIVDYADILAPPPGVVDVRERINQTWMKLRGISQEFHCLLVTATQADAASYDKKLITKANFSNDKRILAHVTGMVGINQDGGDEKDDDVTRLNWVILRDRPYSENHVVFCAGNRAAGEIAVKSV